jgi:hypothetical protein
MAAADAGSAPRRVLQEGLWASLAYTVVAVLVTWPLATELGSSIIGDPDSDAGGTVAWLWSLGQEGGYHVFGATEHTLTGAPLGWKQGNAINLQWLPTYYPAYLVSLLVGEVVAYNLTILSGLVLSAVAMYALARRLGCAPLVAGWAGLVFMIFPWHIWRVNEGHGSLVHLEVFPLLVLALHAWTQQPTHRRAALVGLATAAAWLFSGYWGAMAAIGSVVFALAVTVLRARPSIRPALARLAALAAAVLVGTLVVGLLSIPGRTEGGITIPRSADDLSVYGGWPADFLAPDRDNPVLGSVADSIQPGLHGSNPGEATLYLGWLTMALAGLWLVTAFARRRGLAPPLVATTAGLAAVLLAGLAFAAPSPAGLGGHGLRQTPSWLLHLVLPEVRVPSRFVALVAVALIPLAALGLQLVYESLRRRAPAGWTRHLAFAAVGAAVVVSSVELFPNLREQTRADRPPPLYNAVQRAPKGVLAEYPFNEGSDYKFWQRLHGRPLLNGARAGTVANDVERRLVDPSTPGTAETLALLGVTAIVTRADALDFVENVPDVPGMDWGEGYELVERFPEGSSAWRVTARPAPAVAILRAPSFAGPDRPHDGFLGYPLSGTTGELEFLSKEAGHVRLSFKTDVLHGTGQVLRIAGATGEVTVPIVDRGTVSQVVIVPRGRSRLILTITGSDPGRAPSIELSGPHVSRAGGRPALRAELISPDPGF